MKVFKLIIKMIYLLVFIIIPLLLSSCNKPIPFGLNPYGIEQTISYQSGTIKLIAENLYVRYVVTDFDESNKGSDDLIFFFHGIGRNEKQWLDKDGFAKQFLEVIKSDKNNKNITVVSISFGMASLIIDDVPYPFDANLESIFINELIPYFQNQLNKHGKIYLLGHSMGGFNSLSLGLRHPDLFPIVIAVSPFVAPVSPFDKSFEEKINNKFLLKLFKKILVYTFKDENKWHEYNAYNIINNKKLHNNPLIIISASEKELPEFTTSINSFRNIMKEKNINFRYFPAQGTHQRPIIDNLIVSLMEEIRN